MLKIVKIGIEVPEKIPEGLHAKCVVCNTVHKIYKSIIWKDNGFKFCKQIKQIDSHNQGLEIGWKTKCQNCGNQLFIPWKFKVNGTPYKKVDQTGFENK